MSFQSSYLFEPKSTAAIFLGASEWRLPRLADGLPFTNASTRLRDYILKNAFLALDPQQDLLDLFNDTRNQAEQVESIATFLVQRMAASERGSAPPLSAVLLHYVGHGVFTGDRRYALLVRASTSRDATKLRMADLAEALRSSAPGARLGVLLDCCYSGEAIADFMSESGTAVMAGVRSGLLRAQASFGAPARGTVVYCSSSRFDVSSAGRGADCTLFTGAVLKALQAQVGRVGFLSFRGLHQATRAWILDHEGDAGVVPQLQETEQLGDDLLDLPAFPSPSENAAIIKKPNKPLGLTRRQWLAGGTAVAGVVGTGTILWKREQILSWFNPSLPVPPVLPPITPTNPEGQNGRPIHITSVQFDGVTGADGAAFTDYVESGIEIYSVSGNWLVGRNYGSPAPYIYVKEKAGEKDNNKLRITAKFGSFYFRSIDIYSSVTQVKYLFTGWQSQKQVFNESATVLNTFGQFASVETKYGNILLDTLYVSVASTPSTPLDNPIGVDNIDVVNPQDL